MLSRSIFALITFLSGSLFAQVNNQAELQIKTGFTSSFRQTVFSADGSKLIAWSNSSELKVYDTKTGHFLKTLDKNTNVIFTVTVNHETNDILAVDFDGTVVIYGADLEKKAIYPSALQEILMKDKKLEKLLVAEIEGFEPGNQVQLWCQLMSIMPSISVFDPAGNELNIFFDPSVYAREEVAIRGVQFLLPEGEDTVADVNYVVTTDKSDLLLKKTLRSIYFKDMAAVILKEIYTEPWFITYFVRNEANLLRDLFTEQSYGITCDANYFNVVMRQGDFDVTSAYRYSYEPRHFYSAAFEMVALEEVNAYLAQRCVDTAYSCRDSIYESLLYEFSQFFGPEKSTYSATGQYDFAQAVFNMYEVMTKSTAQVLSQRGIAYAELESLPAYGVEVDKSLTQPVIAACTQDAVFYVDLRTLNVKSTETEVSYYAEHKVDVDSTGRYVRFLNAALDTLKTGQLSEIEFFNGDTISYVYYYEGDEAVSFYPSEEFRAPFIPCWTYSGANLVWDTQTGEVLYETGERIVKGNRYYGQDTERVSELFARQDIAMPYGPIMEVYYSGRDQENNWSLDFEIAATNNKRIDLSGDRYVYNNQYETIVVQDEKIIRRLISTSIVQSVDFIPGTGLLMICTADGLISYFKIEDQSNEPVLQMCFINDGYIFYTPGNYYMTNKSFGDKVFFYHNGERYPYDQFDLKYNRPDKVLEAIGSTDTVLISSLYKAYQKRLQKMNFTEEMLQDDINLPQLQIKNIDNLPASTADSSLNLDLNMYDEKFELDRVNVWVNDVPLFGRDGISLREEHVKTITKSIRIPLAKGNNTIDVAVLNSAGAESYKKRVIIESMAGKSVPDLYIVSIGVSEYADSRYALGYAAKDAVDLVNAFEKSSNYADVHSRVLLNKSVTLDSIASLAAFLEPAGINDQVIVFIAGHGVLDAGYNYYLAGYDADFSNPSLRGIPYEMIENLLDGIRPLRKLLLMDTCHSGELDKDDITIADAANGEESGIVFRNAGIHVVTKPNPLGMQNTSELVSTLFVDLRKGTGATVISSSTGIQLSKEGDSWHNGLFTYCLVDGMVNGRADVNHNGEIDVQELQLYVQQQVTELSGGTQTPNARIKNKSMNFRVW